MAGEERLNKLLATMAEGVVFIEPTGEITYTNPAAEELLGLDRPAIEKRHYTSAEWEILRPDGTAMPAKEMAGARAMIELRRVAGQVMGVRRPDGSVGWMSVSASPVIDESGALAGVVGTFADITGRKRAEEETRRLAYMLMEEGERVRAAIAADLHDDVGQSLNTLKMAFDMLIKKGAGAAEDEPGERIAKIREMLAQTIERVRNITVELAPSDLADFGLESALDRYLEGFARDTGSICSFKTEGIPARVGVEVETSLFRIAQEALANVRKHSRASSVGVSTSWSESVVTLSVWDDGVGFDVVKAYKESRNGDHFGLLGMRERAGILEGDFIVESEPGAGTTMTVTLPLERG